MKRYLKLLAAILVAAACGKEKNAPDKPVTPPDPDPEPEVVMRDFKACIAEQVSGADAAFSWNEGEAIEFFWDGGSSTVGISEAKDTIEFEQEVKAGTYYAAFPASAVKDRYGNALMMDIPTKQKGSFGEVCIWLAKADADNRLFELRSLCAFGSFDLVRNDIKKITIAGNKGEGIAGTVYASFDGEGIPFSNDADAEEISIEPSRASVFAPGKYYFAAAPGTLSEGISFTLETSGGNVMIGYAHPEETSMGRAAVLDFGTIDDISKADALRLRFIFGPDAGTKALRDPDGRWPDTAGDEDQTDGVYYPYALEGTDYHFFVKDLSGENKCAWRTNNSSGYADCIGIQTATIYFGLPALAGYKLTGAVVGQCRRGAGDNATTKVTQIGITNSIPDEADAAKTYVSGGELQSWPGWEGKADKTVVDHAFNLSGTEINTVYYLTSNTQAIGLYFARLVLTYEKPDSHFKGFPDEWEQEGGEPADIYADADIRILFIGNSFTRDAVYHLPGIINAAGIDKKILLTHMYYGGRTAQRFYKHWSDDRDYTCYQALPGADNWVTNKAGSASTLAEMAAVTDWDVITIQEHTGNQTSWYWTDDEKTALQGLIDYAKAAKTGNTPKVHYVMSQAYLNLEKAGSNQCFTNEAEMYNVITTQARKVMVETDFDGIISTGTMLQNLRTSSLNDELHLSRDGFHMNLGISRYGAACTVFESIITPLTGKNLDGNSYRYEGDDAITIPVTDENAPIALAAARAAIQKPFEITSMAE
ncbi:MAG: DUF4886 domain-containing protein [Bacteroidales bacterium]|nr:DUF4886 domain-containing protein [Bacteroidales bacterium]